EKKRAAAERSLAQHEVQNWERRAKRSHANAARLEQIAARAEHSARQARDNAEQAKRSADEDQRQLMRARKHLHSLIAKPCQPMYRFRTTSSSCAARLRDDFGFSAGSTT